ncbi:hypothetical protein [Helicobacter pylori]|uniref:hypothetical protein n=1 Tax=Helicobacter pylori TaxID=210 RepID=UPI0018EA1178|nr:hypothetical protein [Helicobacter pylori]WQU61013.1 hypothetical protein KVE06_00405 [Helicobacter pylori]
MEALTLFLWGENLELLGFVVVVGSYLKKGLGVLSLLSYRVKISFKLALGVGD